MIAFLVAEFPGAQTDNVWTCTSTKTHFATDPTGMLSFGGKVLVKDLYAYRLHHQGSGNTVQLHNVEASILLAGAGSQILWWGGEIGSVQSYGPTGFARYFGVHLASTQVATDLTADSNTELIGCVV